MSVSVGEPFSARCPFDDSLTGWTVTESGGTAGNAGAVTASDCVATLSEGDSFVTTLQTSFTVPTDATSISFEFANLNFDTSDSGFVRDAFEAALVAEDGISVVPTFSSGRDAFLNITEGVPAATGAGTVIDGSVVTVDVSQVLPNQTVTLLLRLVNNDSDTATHVEIVDYVLPEGTPAVSTAMARPGFASPVNVMAIPVASALRFDGSEEMSMLGFDTSDTMSLDNDLATVMGSTPGRSIHVMASLAEASVGATITVHGRAQAVGTLNDGSANVVAEVQLNGESLTEVSAAGEFTTDVVLSLGKNDFDFNVVDTSGERVSATITLVGTQSVVEPIFAVAGAGPNPIASTVPVASNALIATPAITSTFATPEVEWIKSEFDVLPNSKNVVSTPSVIDLNNDGTPEIVFFTFVNPNNTTGVALRVVSGDSGNELWSVTESDGFLFSRFSHTAIGDIDGDGIPDIIAVESTGGFGHNTASPRLLAFGHDGTFKWRSPDIWGELGVAHPP